MPEQRGKLYEREEGEKKKEYGGEGMSRESSAWLQVVAGEVQTIMAAMNIYSTPSWSYYTDDRSSSSSSSSSLSPSNSPPLLKSFIALKKRLEAAQQQPDPLVFLKPFLEVFSFLSFPFSILLGVGNVKWLSNLSCETRWFDRSKQVAH